MVPLVRRSSLDRRRVHSPASFAAAGFADVHLHVSGDELVVVSFGFGPVGPVAVGKVVPGHVPPTPSPDPDNEF
jgi:hypothetical protein